MYITQPRNILSEFFNFFVVINVKFNYIIIKTTSITLLNMYEYQIYNIFV